MLLRQGRGVLSVAPMRDSKLDSESMLDWATLVGVAVSGMSSSLFARAVFYPTLLWNVALRSSTRRWYDRIDSTVLLGALPFKSLTKTVGSAN